MYDILYDNALPHHYIYSYKESGYSNKYSNYTIYFNNSASAYNGSVYDGVTYIHKSVSFY